MDVRVMIEFCLAHGARALVFYHRLVVMVVPFAALTVTTLAAATAGALMMTLRDYILAIAPILIREVAIMV
jgi:hypothetical protein